MHFLSCCLAVVLFFAAAYVVSNLFLIPLPFLGKNGKESGAISDIDYVHGMYMVSLHHKITAPRSYGWDRVMSGTVSNYVYFRKWQELPQKGRMIKVETLFYHFSLRDETFSFVRSWEYADEISVRKKAIIIAKSAYA